MTPKTHPDHADSIAAAHAQAAIKIHGHEKDGVVGRLTLLLNHVNDTTEAIVDQLPDSDQKALLKAFIASNRTGGIAEIISLSGAA